MKQMNCRSLSLVLVLLLLLPGLSACSEKNADTPENPVQAVDPAGEVSGSTDEDTDEIDFSSMSFIDRVKYANAAVSDNLPAVTYDDKTLLIHHHYPDDYFPEEMTGEIVNDAVFEQKLTVEDRFKVKIRYFCATPNDWDPYVANMNAMFLSGDHFTDLVANWNTSTADLVRQGFFADLSQFDVIDTTKPWFFRDEMDLYGYKGHQYVATGTMDVRSTLGRFTAVYFNKTVRTNYGMDDFYAVVREGRFTMDYVKKIVSDFYYDLDGDGTKNDADLYGLSYARAGSWMVTLPTLGLPQIDKDSEDNLILSVASRPERSEVIMDAMRELTQLDGARSISDWGTEAFVTGNALFAVYELSLLTTLRDSDLDYGILPPWKADEAQDAYYASYLPDPWAIAICAEDKEMSAVILTALAAEGFKQVLPAYYETAIKSKYSSDEESGEMLDLMLNNVRADGMFMYGDSSSIYNLWQYTAATQGFGSYWKAKQKMLEKTMNNILEGVASLTGD